MKKQNDVAVSGFVIRRSADFQVCCIAGYQTGRPHDIARTADLEIGDTAGLETGATRDPSRFNQPPGNVRSISHSDWKLALRSLCKPLLQIYEND